MYLRGVNLSCQDFVLITDCSRSKISEYDLWTKGDGKQEVKVFLRSLKQIVEGILADIGFKDRQYLWFEYRQNERRTLIWTCQRSNLVANYGAPDWIRSCPDRHCYFSRRVVGKIESHL